VAARVEDLSAHDLGDAAQLALPAGDQAPPPFPRAAGAVACVVRVTKLAH
jgi:hypothetical protein